MQERFKVLQGEGIPSYYDRLLKIGGATLVFAQKSVRFSIIMAAEIGNSLMYPEGQDGYAKDLEAREPGDRAKIRIKEALRAFRGEGYKPEELSTFAALDFVSANKELEKIDPDTAIENTEVIATLIEKIPNTKVGAGVAEEIAAKGLAIVVDEVNDEFNKVRHIHQPIPTQRPPSE